MDQAKGMRPLLQASERGAHMGHSHCQHLLTMRRKRDQPLWPLNNALGKGAPIELPANEPRRRNIACRKRMQLAKARTHPIGVRRCKTAQLVVAWHPAKQRRPPLIGYVR